MCSVSQQNEPADEIMVLIIWATSEGSGDTWSSEVDEESEQKSDL